MGAARTPQSSRSAARRAAGFVLIGLLCAAATVAPADAATLYGAANGFGQGSGPSSLYSIDPATGAATLIGPIGFTNVTGLAFLGDGRLVGSANGDDIFGAQSSILIEIDPTTGAGTLIGEIDTNQTGGCGRMPDITYDPSTDTLYGYADFCGLGVVEGDTPEGLFTIDPNTGAGTSVGESGYTGGGNGLAREPSTGIFYATPDDNNSLVILDPVTSAGSDVPGSAGNVLGNVNALAFDPDSGVLYGSQRLQASGVAEGAPSVFSLLTIATGDGTETTVGTTETGLDAIVFGPEPSPLEIPALSIWGLALLAVALAGAALAFLRR
jgi:IPTL-CTERM motif